jgi:hypothetical protein
MTLEGISWWDNCNWNSNNATIITAKKLHSIVLLTYNINER